VRGDEAREWVVLKCLVMWQTLSRPGSVGVEMRDGKEATCGELAFLDRVRSNTGNPSREGLGSRHLPPRPTRTSRRNRLFLLCQRGVQSKKMSMITPDLQCTPLLHKMLLRFKETTPLGGQL
jgi:hypothetical protein